ncbi:E3 ubiquitin-protein ligase bre1 [Tieghemiomyces parasiticus]|uniref:E3 ubiquitin protein ligase n=1 Tax=Tieghemiomyces parasiticus TaxID=78921 RepID=A0A9W8A5C0_9FUNG|nr:E3 ubiquitin-protein ligase bre1 [Tieghemiomyces parasiticus]
MTDKKRPSDDLATEHAPMDPHEEPPLKKRVASHSNLTSPVLPESANDGFWDTELIQQFKKEALVRKVREHERESIILRQDLDDLEANHNRHLEQLSWLCVRWDQVTNDLQTVAELLGQDPPSPKDSAGDLCQLLLSTARADLAGETLPEPLAQRASAVQATVDGIAGAVTEFIERRRTWLTQAARHDLADAEKEQLWQETYAEQLRLTELLRKHAERPHPSSLLTSQLEAVRAEAETLRQQLQVTRQQLFRSEKRLDRLRSPATNQIFHPDLASGKQSPSHPPAAVALGAGSPTAAVTSSIPVAAVSATGVGGPPSVNSEELEEARKLAEARLHELETLTEERASLRSTIEILRQQLGSVPDSIVLESSLYRHLAGRKEFYQSELQRYKAAAEQYRAELDELKEGRRQFQENLETEEKARRKALEAEMKRLESDSARLRAQRDQIQQRCDVISTKEEVDSHANQEVRTLANSRKERITAFTAEVRRLRLKIAADAGDKDATEFYQVNEELSYAESLKQQLSAAEARIIELTQQVKSFEQAVGESRSVQEILLESQLHQAREAELEKALADLRARCGLDGDAAGPEAKAEAYARRIDTLETELFGLRVAEQGMMRELEHISQGWAQLHEQNSSKVFDAVRWNDQLQHYQAEKAKLLHKFAGLSKQKDNHANLNLALKRKSDKQTEHIKALEEKEKALGKQNVLLEKEALAAQAATRACKDRLEEVALRSSELVDNVARAEGRIAEAQRALTERTQQVEREAHQNRRLQEECQTLKRKLERSSKEQADEDLQTDLANYKKLAKCHACDARLKTHALMRCMHVFCHECLQARLDTRQRKCPTCGEPFGVKDVRRIYV